MGRVSPSEGKLIPLPSPCHALSHGGAAVCVADTPALPIAPCFHHNPASASASTLDEPTSTSLSSSSPAIPSPQHATNTKAITPPLPNNTLPPYNNQTTKHRD